jgi:hypothetical protein
MTFSVTVRLLLVLLILSILNTAFGSGFNPDGNVISNTCSYGVTMLDIVGHDLGTIGSKELYSGIVNEYVTTLRFCFNDMSYECTSSGANAKATYLVIIQCNEDHILMYDFRDSDYSVFDCA